MNKQLRSEAMQVLHFQIKNITACIDLRYITKGVLLPRLEFVPDGPSYLAGLMNCAGDSIPIIDLAIRLKIQRNEKYFLETPVLLCQVGDKKIGLIVDKIIGISTIFPSDIQMTDKLIEKGSAFLGTVILESRIVYFIDLNNIISTDENLHAFKEMNEYQLTDNEREKV